MRRAAGFTLVEMLVVIGIIGLLAAILIPTMRGVRRRAAVRTVQARIQTIASALRNYAADFQDFPPSTLERLGLRTNGVNEGIESLVRCLSTQEQNGPYFEPDEETLKNLDSDRIERDFNRSYMGTLDAFEIVDEWGNPFIYLHNTSYDDPGRAATVNIGGRRATVRAARSSVTQQYEAFTEFQLWSAGPDGENANGGGDDIVSW